MDAMTAETASSAEAGTMYDQQTPVQVIAGRVSDTLRLKLQRCVEKMPEVLMDMGLMEWTEFTHFGYDCQPIARTSLLMYEDLVAGAEGLSKPDSRLKLSHSQADMMAKAARAVARGYLGMPEEPRSPGGSNTHTPPSPYSKTDSQLSNETARLSLLSHLKCNEKLETVNGPSRPAHVYDVMTFVDETTKVLVGLPGYESMQEQLELRRKTPALTLDAFAENAGVQTEEWKQQSRLIYQGVPSQYKKDVLAKSRYAKRLFDPGVLVFALYETALNISVRDATRKKLSYLEIHPVRPNDKNRMEVAHKSFERNSFELLQLRELGSAHAEISPQTMQYNTGMVLYSNYSDLTHDWARIWKEGEQSMDSMAGMMQHMSERIDQLPDIRPYRAPEFPPGLVRPVTATPTHPEPHKNICRQFARTGSCSYGDRCKFSHAKQQQAYMAQMDDRDNQVVQLQDAMNQVFDVTAAREEGTPPISKSDFLLAYDAAYSTVGTDGFESTHSELCFMIQEERSDIDDCKSNDGWHI